MQGQNKDIGQLQDEQLLEEYRKSADKNLVGILFKRYSHLVLGLCLKYLKNEDEAKDAVVGIFEKLMKDLLSHEVQRFKPWLCTVSRNYCLMHLRKYKKQWQQEEDVDKVVHLDGEIGDEAARLKEVELSLLEDGIASLKDEQQRCVELFYLKQYSYEQVATETGMTAKSVKSNIQNGKRNLRLFLLKHHEFRRE